MAAISGSGGIGQPRGIGKDLFGIGLQARPGPTPQPPDFVSVGTIGVSILAVVLQAWVPPFVYPQSPSITPQGAVFQPPSVLVPEIVSFDDPPLPQSKPPVAHLVAPGGNWQGQPDPLWLATVLKAWEPLPPQVPLVQKAPPLVQGGSNWQAGGLPEWLPSVLQAWVPPFVLPQPEQLLVPPTAQVVVQPPSVGVPFIVTIDDFVLPQTAPRTPQVITTVIQQAYTRPWLDGVVSAWQPLLDTRPQPSSRTPQGGGDSAFVRYWLDPVVGQWQVSQDTRPQPPSRTPQGGGDRVVPPRPWLDPIIGQWQINPDTRPQPPSRTPQGGGDRVVPRSLWLDPVVSGWQVNPDTRPQPPARTAQGGGDRVVPRQSWLDSVVSGWQVNPDTRPQPPSHTAQGGGDRQPFTRTWLDGVVVSWQPLDFRLQPAAITPQAATTVFQQAFTRPWLDSVVVSWQPLDIRPQPPVRTPPPTPQADAPPSVGVPFIVVVDDFVLPQVAPRTPQVTATTVFQGAFTRPWLDGVVLSWQPQDIRPQPPVHTPPQTGGDQVVFDGRKWQMTVWQTWQPPDPLPTLSPKQTPPNVNAPPVGVQPPPWEAFMWWHWQAPPPLPTIPPHMAHLIPPPPIVTSTAKFLLIMGVGT